MRKEYNHISLFFCLIAPSSLNNQYIELLCDKSLNAIFGFLYAFNSFNDFIPTLSGKVSLIKQQRNIDTFLKQKSESQQIGLLWV